MKYKDFVQTLPADVQLDVDRYLNIFKTIQTCNRIYR